MVYVFDREPDGGMHVNKPLAHAASLAEIARETCWVESSRKVVERTKEESMEVRLIGWVSTWGGYGSAVGIDKEGMIVMRDAVLNPMEILGLLSHTQASLLFTTKNVSLDEVADYQPHQIHAFLAGEDQAHLGRLWKKYLSGGKKKAPFLPE